MAESTFNGSRVLALESRREKEVAALIRASGGIPTVVPAMREVPFGSNREALAFAKGLMAGRFGLVVLLTGVGARILLNAAETLYSRAELCAALKKTQIAVRGPKPMAVLREFGVKAAIVAQEPSTWREVLAAIDVACGEGLRGLEVAVQEYGAANQSLLDGLELRGALVMRVPVYRWALPEDLSGLRAAVSSIERQEFEITLFLTGVQAEHLFDVAGGVGRRDELRSGLQRLVVASVGPSTTEELVRQGVPPDFQPSHPKMGILISELARAAAGLIEKKRNH